MQRSCFATCYANGVAPITGQFQVDLFGAHNITAQRGGENVVVPTWRRIPDTTSTSGQE